MFQILKTYISKNTMESVIWKTFMREFEEYIRVHNISEAIGKVNWQQWIQQPGLAPVQLDFMTPEILNARNLADDYVSMQGDSSPQNFSDFHQLHTNLKEVFLQRLKTLSDKNQEVTGGRPETF